MKLDLNQQIGPSNSLDPNSITNVFSEQLDLALVPEKIKITPVQSIAPILPGNIVNPSSEMSKMFPNYSSASSGYNLPNLEAASGYTPSSTANNINQKSYGMAFENQTNFTSNNYRNSDVWDKFGYVVGRDNLAIYEKEQPWTEVAWNSTKGLWNQLKTSHNDTWKSYGRDFKAITEGNFNALLDLGYDPNQTQKLDQWQNPIFDSPNYGNDGAMKWIPFTQGSGAFYGNLTKSMGFTLGVLAQTLEEAGLMYAGSALLGSSVVGAPVGAAAATAETANAVKKLNLIRKIWDVTKGTLRTGSVLNDLRQITNGGANTLNIAKATINTARNIRSATGEASITVAMNHANNLDLFKQNYRDKYQIEASADEINKFNAVAAEANKNDYIWQSAVLFATNLVNESALFGMFKSNTAEAAGNAFLRNAMRDVVFREGVAQTAEQAVRALPWYKTILSKSGNIVKNYLKGNLSEGFQEISQSWLDGAANRYIDNQLNGLKSESYLQALSQSFLETGQDQLDEAWGGFIMGVPISAVNSSFKQITGQNKQSVSSDLAEQLNTSRQGFFNAIGQNALDFNRMNLSNQSELMNSIYDSVVNRDQLSYNVYRNQALQNYVMSALQTDSLEVRKQELKDLLNLDETELKSQLNLDNNVNKSEIDNYINNVLGTIDKIESSYKTINSKIKNPFDKTQFDKHIAFELAKNDAIFNLHNQDFAITNANSLMSGLRNDFNLSDEDINVILDNEVRSAKISELQTTVTNYNENPDLKKMIQDLEKITLFNTINTLDAKKDLLKLLKSFDNTGNINTIVDYLNEKNNSQITNIDKNRIVNDFNLIHGYNNLYRFSQNAVEHLLDIDKFESHFHSYENAIYDYKSTLQKYVEEMRRDMSMNRGIDEFLTDPVFEGSNFALNNKVEGQEKTLSNDFVLDVQKFLENKYGVEINPENINQSEGFINGNEQLDPTQIATIRGVYQRAQQLQETEVSSIKSSVFDLDLNNIPENIINDFIDISNSNDLVEFADDLSANPEIEAKFKPLIDRLANYYDEKLESVEEKRKIRQQQELRTQIENRATKFVSTSKTNGGDYYIYLDNELIIYKDVDNVLRKLNLNNKAGQDILIDILKTKEADTLKLALLGKDLASRIHLGKFILDSKYVDDYLELLAKDLKTKFGLTFSTDDPNKLNVFTFQIIDQNLLSNSNIDKKQLNNSIANIFENYNDTLKDKGKITDLKNIKSLSDLLENDDLVEGLRDMGLFNDVITLFEKTQQIPETTPETITVTEDITNTNQNINEDGSGTDITTDSDTTSIEGAGTEIINVPETTNSLLTDLNNRLDLSDLTSDDLNQIRIDILVANAKNQITNSELQNLMSTLNKKLDSKLKVEVKNEIKTQTENYNKEVVKDTVPYTVTSNAANTFLKTETNFLPVQKYLFGTEEEKANANPNIIDIRNFNVFDYISNQFQNGNKNYSITFSQPDILWPLPSKDAGIRTDQGKDFDSAYQYGIAARKSFTGAGNTNQELQDRLGFLEGHITDKEGNILYFDEAGNPIQEGNAGYGDPRNVVTINLPSNKSLDTKWGDNKINVYNERKQRLIKQYIEQEKLDQTQAEAKFNQLFEREKDEIQNLRISYKYQPVIYDIIFGNTGNVTIDTENPKPMSSIMSNPDIITFENNVASNLPYFKYGEYNFYIKPNVVSNDVLSVFKGLFSGDIPQSIVDIMEPNSANNTAQLLIQTMLNRYVYRENIKKLNVNKLVKGKLSDNVETNVYTNQIYTHFNGTAIVNITTKGGTDKYGFLIFNDEDGNIINPTSDNLYPGDDLRKLELQNDLNLERPMLNFVLDYTDKLKFIVEFYNPETNSVQYIDKYSDFEDVIRKTYKYKGKDFNFNLNFDKKSITDDNVDMLVLEDGNVTIKNQSYKQFVFNNGSVNINLDNRFKNSTPYLSLNKAKNTEQNFLDTNYISELSNKFNQSVKFFLDEKNIEKELDLLENSGTFNSKEEFNTFKNFVLKETKLSKGYTIDDYLKYKDCI